MSITTKYLYICKYCVKRRTRDSIGESREPRGSAMKALFRTMGIAALAVVVSVSVASAKENCEVSSRTDLLRAGMNIAANTRIKQAGTIGYISSGIEVGEAFGSLVEAQASYDAAPRRQKKQAACKLRNAEEGFGEAVISATPVLGDSVSLVRAVEKGDVIRIGCHAASLAGTFATGGASSVLSSIGLGCAVFSLAETIKDSETSRPYARTSKSKWGPREAFGSLNVAGN